MAIHPTACVDPRAEVDPTADVRQYVVIEGPVRIGPRTVVQPFAFLAGSTEIGADCNLHSGCSIGDVPQDRAFKGGETFCRVGDGTIVREGATIHRGSTAGTSTIVGQRCFIMANAHVGHNCHVEDDVILVNGALLGGYVHVGPRAFISGNAAVHQFVRVGELAMIGGLAKITQDVPPFFMADGAGVCVGTNLVGLKRAGFTSAERAEVKTAYAAIYRSGGNLREVVARLAETVTTRAGRSIVSFLQAESRRGLTAGPRAVRDSTLVPMDDVPPGSR